ncbi:response regulator [Propionibacterium australiense]|uniref:CheY-like superfamily n=1 Tax=Propionibacterium australiense TaxID=119981 RepID=A0A383S6M4_9ACTN|nr:response regulator transcription factor [Propionibacterium australiense]RLP09660.1 response regulator [Propionibacterium australiense]RLP12362.1 response regulator [Propionibacterium australiense]SYZ33567.1 CheY-like superfamily [Propionibacterium australiense]VEH89559.1 Response regulator protein vraR [Propionibacterium australiense]
MIRVIVVDDQALVRCSLASLIGAEPDIDVVGEAADGEQAVAVALTTRPDVVLMDLRMPGVDGLEATRRILAEPALAHTRVCVLTMFELDEYVFGALRAGASGFLLKDAEPEVVADAVRRMAGGEQLLAPSVLRRVIEQSLTARAPVRELPQITAREREVLGLIGRGLNNAEIERELFISRSTLKTHIAHLLTKLDARDRPQLVIIAHEAGCVPDRP